MLDAVLLLALRAPVSDVGDPMPRAYSGPTAVDTVPQVLEPTVGVPRYASEAFDAHGAHGASAPAPESNRAAKTQDNPGWRDKARIPAFSAGAAVVRPWVRSTTFTQWYRDNYNTRQSDDGLVVVAERLSAGTDVRLRRVTLGARFRVDGQKIAFPNGQDCSGDCVPVDDDVRLERTTLSVATRTLSAEAGDFNASFGRGMGLSVRKVDLIGVDATIKGGRVDLRTKPVRATGLAGFSNRQNSDFATRQLIEDPGFPAQSYTFAPQVGERACSRPAGGPPPVGNPWWTVCSDLVAGGRLEGTLPGQVDLGAHYVYVDFGDELSLGIDEYSHLVGGDLSRVNIGGVWDLFVGAGGVLRNPNLRGTPLQPQSFVGRGVYASNVLVFGTTTVLVEAKYYQDYLLALSQSSLLQYAEHPTLEREDQQVPGNQNAAGGRVRVDHAWRDIGLTVFASTLEYAYAEDLGSSAFGELGRLATHNYLGVIWRKPSSDFVLQVSGGYRYERFLEAPAAGPLKRRFGHGEFYLTIPLAKRNGLSHALSVRGDGRFENFRTVGSGEDFFRGLFTFGYGMSPWFSISYLQGFDTEQPTPAGEPSLTRERCQGGSGSLCRPHIWPGVQAQVNIFGASFLRVFAGRQVGGRVCVNGSCRTLPDFEGVRAELVFSL